MEPIADHQNPPAESGFSAERARAAMGPGYQLAVFDERVMLDNPDLPLTQPVPRRRSSRRHRVPSESAPQLVVSRRSRRIGWRVAFGPLFGAARTSKRAARC